MPLQPPTPRDMAQVPPAPEGTVGDDDVSPADVRYLVTTVLSLLRPRRKRRRGAP